MEGNGRQECAMKGRSEQNEARQGRAKQTRPAQDSTTKTGQDGIENDIQAQVRSG